MLRQSNLTSMEAGESDLLSISIGLEAGGLSSIVQKAISRLFLLIYYTLQSSMSKNDKRNSKVLTEKVGLRMINNSMQMSARNVNEESFMHIKSNS